MNLNKLMLLFRVPSVSIFTALVVLGYATLVLNDPPHAPSTRVMPIFVAVMLVVGSFVFAQDICQKKMKLVMVIPIIVLIDVLCCALNFLIVPRSVITDQSASIVILVSLYCLGILGAIWASQQLIVPETS